MPKNYDELEFSDDFMFCKILSTNPNLCKELLSLILNKNIDRVIIPVTQKPIEITADGKGIRLDVYVEDEDIIYDIEMQTTSNKNLAKRTRYYQGMIDLDLIGRGADYSELKSSYIIFICLQDPFDKGAAVYTMENRCEEFDNLYLEDGTKKIFLFADGSSADISDELRDFLDYVSTGKANGSLSRVLKSEVDKAKGKEDWRAEYMTLELKYKEKFNEGKLETLISLVKKGLLNIADAIKESGLSENEFKQMMNVEQK